MSVLADSFLHNIHHRYAVRESTSRVKIFKNFKERSGLLPKLNYSAEGIHGGTLLCVRASGFLTFYDWETGMPVRRIEAEAKNVSWKGKGIEKSEHGQSKLNSHIHS
jgi:hypothetical protein